MNPRSRPRIVVTPAGRRAYLEILYKHLVVQRSSFDTWQLWLNTTNEDDLLYMRNLAMKHPDWIVARELSEPHNGNFSICSFFPGASIPGTTYLRLDDDIVWLESGFIENIMSYREAHTHPFLVYGNIVNNAITSHVFQRLGCIDTELGIVGYECMDTLGWKSPEFATKVHRTFLESHALHDLDRWKYPIWTLSFYERVSINAIAWLGEDFATFNGAVGRDEEQWLSVDKPRSIRRPNVILGNKLCAHYAFFPQRPELDKTNILEEYKKLAMEPGPTRSDLIKIL
jgi:hypothetical protein